MEENPCAVSKNNSMHASIDYMKRVQPGLWSASKGYI